MNIDATLEALRPRLSLAALRQSGGDPFAVEVEGGPHVELRFIDAQSALALVIPLGDLLRAHLREAGLRLLLSNLFLAESGQPHYALDPREGQVCLCRMVPVDSPDSESVLLALRDLLTAWAPTRSALQDLRVIA